MQKRTLSNFILLCLIHFSLFAEKINTFYGPLDVHEPVLLELIESPAFERLKFIHQYGVSYYTTHREEYSRYDHSLGVFAILRLKNASLEEQIAGLLHDVSHTVFSHVGDWIFQVENQDKDYQNSIHASYLRDSGLEQILHKYHVTIDQILPLEELFPALEQKKPNLCADRIDYNIQGAYHQGFITYKEAQELLDDLQFTEGKWICTKPELMSRLARFSLHMTESCWGSARNDFHSRWLAEAILRAIELKSLSYEEVHFGTDDAVWDLLTHHEDPLIQKIMHKIADVNAYFECVTLEEADDIIASTFRGINPWIYHEEKLVRLTEIDPLFATEYNASKERVERGWPIKYLLPN